MRTILFILRKEFLQIFRHKVMLPLIFVMPIVQLLILANAADYEVKNINLHVIDHDISESSQRLIGLFEASSHFNIVNSSFNTEAGIRDLESDKADLFIEIPPQFERNLAREDESTIQVTINAINGVKAGIANSYTQSIIRNLNQQIRVEWLDMPASALEPPIRVTFSNWFNPSLDYYTFMVPGILVMLVTLVGMFLSGMNIVKEKEIGTIEQLNVSPIRKHQFIIGKLLPFWIIANVELAFGLLIGKLVFDIPIVGSLVLVFGFSALYLLVVMGIGLLVSTITDTQQQAMFISWFFLVIFILMSGLFTPIESMPPWAQEITRINPIAYFVEVMRLVLLKGSGLWEIRNHFFILAFYALLINGLAVLNYRKTS